MTKQRKILTVVLSIVFAFIIALLITSYFLFVHHYRGKNVVDNFDSKKQFDINSVSVLEKKKDKDFVILNLADIQYEDSDSLKARRAIHNEITYLVETIKPDLITLSGDQVQDDDNYIAIKSIIAWLDSYKIPYAPIFGNHDFGEDYNSAVVGEKYSCDLYESGKYSLFRRGPTNIGALGNYVINIVEEGKIIKTLYMMNYGPLMDFTSMQVNWFKWVANGIKTNNENVYPEGIMFTHKPTSHTAAYKYYLKNPESAEGPVYKFEDSWDASNQSFITAAKNMGVTDFICGHNHANNFTINYNGARFTSVVKTAETCYIYKWGGYTSTEQPK